MAANANKGQIGLQGVRWGRGRKREGCMHLTLDNATRANKMKWSCRRSSSSSNSRSRSSEADVVMAPGGQTETWGWGRKRRLSGVVHGGTGNNVQPGGSSCYIEAYWLTLNAARRGAVNGIKVSSKIQKFSIWLASVEQQRAEQSSSATVSKWKIGKLPLTVERYEWHTDCWIMLTWVHF